MASEDNRKSEAVIEIDDKIINLNDKVSKSKRGAWIRFWNKEAEKKALILQKKKLKLVVYVVLDLSFVYITFVFNVYY